VHSLTTSANTVLSCSSFNNRSTIAAGSFWPDLTAARRDCSIVAIKRGSCLANIFSCSAVGRKPLKLSALRALAANIYQPTTMNLQRAVHSAEQPSDAEGNQSARVRLGLDGMAQPAI
jgi:hypothetical protein